MKGEAVLSEESEREEKVNRRVRNNEEDSIDAFVRKSLSQWQIESIIY